MLRILVVSPAMESTISQQLVQIVKLLRGACLKSEKSKPLLNSHEHVLDSAIMSVYD